MKNINRYVVVIAIGLLLGVMASLGHTYLTREYGSLAFSYSIWLSATFIAGLFAVNKKQSLLFGAVVPIVAFITAYMHLALFLSGGTVALSMLTVFLVGDVFIGPGLAYLALLWKQHQKQAILAPIIVSALLLSEGVAYKINLVSDGLEYLFVTLSVIAFGLLYRKKFNMLYMLAILPLSILLFATYIVAMSVILVIQYSGSGFID